MLAFLQDNKVSLAKLAQPAPLSSDTVRPSCHLLWRDQPQKKMEPVPSPVYKRRKIFERIETQDSNLSGELDLPTYSAVSPYQMPKFESPAGECKISKRKQKTSKENGLCLVRVNQYEASRQVRQQGEKEREKKEVNDHLESYKKGESQRQKRVEELENYNHQLLKSIQIEDELYTSKTESLIINEAHGETFTFHSSHQSSLRYSPSKYWSSISKPTPQDLHSPLQLSN